MAEILSVDINYLLTENEEFYINANEKYGATGAQQAKKRLCREVTGLFAGGELDQDDMDDDESHTGCLLDSKKRRTRNTLQRDKEQNVVVLTKRSPKQTELYRSTADAVLKGSRELDIEVLERDFSKQKGAYKLILKNPFIFIKRDLCDSMKKSS